MAPLCARNAHARLWGPGRTRTGQSASQLPTLPDGRRHHVDETATARSTSAMAAPTTGQARTVLGPLTTTFTPLPSCTVALAQCPTCTIAWQVRRRGQVDTPLNIFTDHHPRLKAAATISSMIPQIAGRQRTQERQRLHLLEAGVSTVPDSTARMATPLHARPLQGSRRVGRFSSRYCPAKPLSAVAQAGSVVLSGMRRPVKVS